MQLFCRQCGAEIRAEDINLDNMIAKCHTCNAVFSFADMYKDVQPKPEKRKNEMTYKPDGMELTYEGNTLHIHRQWSRGQGAMMLVFGIIWMIFIVGLFTPNFVQMKNAPIALFLVPFYGAGIFMILNGLFNLVNTSTIAVNDQWVKTFHHPLPWLTKSVATQDLRQVFVTQEVSRHRNSKSHTTTYSYSYTVRLILHSGEQVKLLTALPKAEEALYMEQQIEKYLQIQNVAVSGQYQPR